MRLRVPVTTKWGVVALALLALAVVEYLYSLTMDTSLVGNLTSLVGTYTECLTNLNTNDPELKGNESLLPLCSEMPPGLGPIPVNKTELKLEWIEMKYPGLELGGMYTPPNCTARHKVAILVPFRDRHHQLGTFLNHMHQFLMKQQLEYVIFIIEQHGNKREFNRAKLLNVGFVESLRLRPWQCFVLHDIDLLPLDLRNMYRCPRQPKHLSGYIDLRNFQLPYENIFGGVSIVTYEQYRRINGMSNKFWGWGGEDDDLINRLYRMNYWMQRDNATVARYAKLDHKKAAPNPIKHHLVKYSKYMQKDGLSTLKYQVIHILKHRLYTSISVDIDEFS